MAELDVVVVGAGPAGSAAAALCADAGLRVAVLEKSLRGPVKVCGEYLSPGCLRILERLGVLASLRQTAAPLRGIRLETEEGGLDADYPGTPAGPVPHALAVRRERLDATLQEAACRRGAELVRGFQVSELLRDGDAVLGVRGRRGGRDTSIRGRLVLGADGRHSVVARRLGAVIPHPWLDKVALVGYFRGPARGGDRAEIFVGCGRYAILNPLAEGVLNLGMVVDRREIRRDEPAEQQVRRLCPTIPGLAARLAGATAVGPVRQLGPLAHRATRLTAPGALLLGDAAGFVDPFTGEGIYAALRGAELAADRAARALAAAAHPDLAGYADDWRREIRAKWPLCLLLQQAIRRPWLARRLVARLASRPAALGRVMSLIGDLRRPSPLDRLVLGLQLLRPAPDGPRCSA